MRSMSAKEAPTHDEQGELPSGRPRAAKASIPYLLHEGLAQPHHLREKDGVVRHVRAQVAQHAEHLPPQVLEGLGGPRHPLTLQGAQLAALGSFGNARSERDKAHSVTEPPRASEAPGEPARPTVSSLSAISINLQEEKKISYQKN